VNEDPSAGLRNRSKVNSANATCGKNLGALPVIREDRNAEEKISCHGIKLVLKNEQRVR